MTALSKRIQSFSMPAAADYSSQQYCLMIVDANGRAAEGTTTTAPFIGVLMNKPAAADREAEIAGPGSVVKCLSGDTIAEGDKVTAEAGGKALTTTTDTNHIAGIALSPAGDGEYFELLVAPSQVAG